MMPFPQSGKRVSFQHPNTTGCNTGIFLIQLIYPVIMSVQIIKRYIPNSLPVLTPQRHIRVEINYTLLLIKVLHGSWGNMMTHTIAQRFFSAEAQAYCWPFCAEMQKNPYSGPHFINKMMKFGNEWQPRWYVLCFCITQPPCYLSFL